MSEMTSFSPPPPPPPAMPNNFGQNWRQEPPRRQEAPPSKEQMEKAQYAMLPDKLLTTLNKDKKPFTYTPQGISGEKGVLDMSEIRSPRMKKRLLANLHAGEEEVTTDDDSRPGSSLAPNPPPTKPAPANIYQQPMAHCVLPPLESVKLRPMSPSFVPQQQKKEVRFAPSPIMFSDDEELTNLLEKRRKDVESRAKICTNQPETEPEHQTGTVEGQCNEKLLYEAASALENAASVFGMNPTVDKVTASTNSEGRKEFGKSVMFALDANNNPTTVEDGGEDVGAKSELVPNSGDGDVNDAILPVESPQYEQNYGQNLHFHQQPQYEHKHQYEQQQQHRPNERESYSSAFTAAPPTHRFEQLSLNDHQQNEFTQNSAVVHQQSPTISQSQLHYPQPEMPVQVQHYHYHHNQHPVQQNYPTQSTMALRPQQANAFQHLLDDLQDEIDEFEQMSRTAMSPEPLRGQRMKSLPPDTRYNTNYNTEPKPFYASVQAPQMMQHRSVQSPLPFNQSPGPIQPNPDFIDSDRMIPVSQQIAERELLAQQCSNQKNRLNDRYINPCTRLIPRRSLLESPRLPEHHSLPDSSAGAKSYEDRESGRAYIPELGIYSQLPVGAQPPELHSPQTPPTPSKMYYGSLPRKVKLGTGGRITPDGHKSAPHVDNGREYLPNSGMFSQLSGSGSPAPMKQQQAPKQYNQQQQQMVIEQHFHTHPQKSNMQQQPLATRQETHYHMAPQQPPQMTQQTTVTKMTTFQPSSAPVPPPKPSLSMMSQQSPQQYQNQQPQKSIYEEENRGHYYNDVDAPRQMLPNGMFSQLPAGNTRQPARHSSVPPSSRWAPQQPAADLWTPPATPPVPTPINSAEYQRMQPKLTPQQVRRLPPSERPPEPNPMKYTGSHNPSRSFRLLQLMTGEDIENHYADEQPEQNQGGCRPQSSQSYFRQPPEMVQQPVPSQQACPTSDFGTDF